MNITAKEIKNKITSLLNQKEDTSNFIGELSCSGDLLFFGGSVRDAYRDTRYSPRDFDIVIKFEDKERFSNLIERYACKINRFGGYKFHVDGVEFDIWELNNTWAFKNTPLKASEENLARSVFLNIDGIVLNYNKEFLYDDLYKNAIDNAELDIALIENPQKELNLLRAMVFKNKYDLEYSNRLKRIFVDLLTEHQEKIIDKLYDIQISHYKEIKLTKERIMDEFKYI